MPWWYERCDCRVSREGKCLHTCSDDLSRELVAHAVTWDRRNSWCDTQPGELPSQPATTSTAQVGLSTGKPAFAEFDFGWWA